MKAMKQKQEKKQKKETKRNMLKGSGFPTMVEMICYVLVLPLGMTYVSNETEAAATQIELRGLLFAVFLLMGVARLMRARRMKLTGKPKGSRAMQFVYAGAFLVCALIPLFFDYKGPIGIINMEESFAFSGDTRQLMALVFWPAMIAGRIVSIRQDRRRRNVILNVLLIIVMLYLTLSTAAGRDMIIATSVVTVQAMAGIFGFVFSRLRIDVLKRIVRKTYASEIITGLLLLMCAFSLVFSITEPQIPTFLDGMWYCFAVVTTIGFGDLTVTGLLARLLTVVLGIYGIIVVALITSIIVNFYGEVRKDDDDGDGDGPEAGVKDEADAKIEAGAMNRDAEGQEALPGKAE